MIEGLWIVKFLGPDDPAMSLNGGVLVIETGRLLGGDSGYVYTGEAGPLANGRCAADVTVTRHDPNMESVFGNVDQFVLRGELIVQEADPLGRSVLLAVMRAEELNMPFAAQLTKVSELP